MPRSQRVVTACKVEYERLGTVVDAVTEDIARGGVFVRTDALLPVGDVVELTLHLPGGGTMTVISRVAHLLSETAARALGRRAGMGFEFLEQDSDRRDRLLALLEELITELTPPPEDNPRSTRVLVVDASTPILERLSTALDAAGFVVETAANGTEAYSAALSRPPEIILAADEMAPMDGWTLIKMLSARPGLADVPVALMSSDASDLTRLRAYRLGVRDFLLKPFTDEEVVIRLRRLALPVARGPERVMLRGNLAEIGVPTLLSLLEFERKSGTLALLSDADVVRLFVASGRVVKVESSLPDADARAKLMRVLDWESGNFEFISGDIVGEDEVGLATQHLLIEHARLRDESRGR